MAGGKLYLSAKAKRPRASGFGGRKKNSQFTRPRISRYNNKYNQLVKIIRPICPQRLLVPLKMTPTVITVTSTSGVSNFDIWRCNNIYSPVDGSTTTPQPMGHDEWAAFYGNYRVLSGSIRVSAHNDTDVQPFRMAILTAGSTSGGASVDSVSEGRGKVHSGGDDGKLVKAYMYRQMHHIFGVSKSNYMYDSKYQSSVNNKPEREGLWQIFIQPFDESTTVNFKVKLTVTYNVLYTNPKFLSQS